MSALGSLVVKLALEYAQFSQGLQSSEQEVKQHAKRVQDAYDNMAAGVSSRMDSLKGSILGAIGGAISVVGITSAISKIKQETIDAEKEQTQLAAAIKSTGGAAGWSIERLNAMADSMEKTSTFSAGQINQAQTRMLSYAGVVGEQFPRAMQAVIDMSERMGYEVTASAETIGKALDVPSEGLTALSKQGFRFTDAQKELVKQFERTGQTAKAQEIILQALESSYGGAAQAARDTLGGSLTAVGNTINSLMTADSASLPGLRDSVEGLNSTLNSDDVRNGFQTLIGGLVDVGTFAASSMAGIVKLGQAVAEHKGEIGVVLGMIAGTATAAGGKRHRRRWWRMGGTEQGARRGDRAEPGPGGEPGHFGAAGDWRGHGRGHRCKHGRPGRGPAQQGNRIPVRAPGAGRSPAGPRWWPQGADDGQA
jgi:hypothetical protein